MIGLHITKLIGDISSYNFKNKFDIVYNTGLIEHFSENKQDKIISNTYDSLKEGGYYITLNPYSGGKFTIKYMKVAKQKNTWDYGEEDMFINSLKQFQKKEFVLVKEYPCCSLLQLSMFFYGNRLLFILLLPIILFFRYFYLYPVDLLFKKYLGQYGLMSVFKKIN